MQSSSATRNALRFASGSLLLLALALFAAPAGAQTTVTGRVLNENNAPLHSATIQLLQRSDSSLVKGALADRQGNFVLEEIKPGTYLILVSHIGYRKFYSDALTLADARRLAVGPFVLQPNAIELEGVAVEAAKPLYQQRGDRLVINVESSPTLAGTSALQVLERSPGVVVDKMTNSISLLGKDGVRVMINGRLSHIPADALAQYLAGVSADNIERIELITTPPAHLDAEGNAGYINVVMKRSPNDGLSGSTTLSGGWGVGELGNASANVNYQRGRINLYGNYSFLWNAQEQHLRNFRRVTDSEGIEEMATLSWRDPEQRNHDARIGLDYQLSGRTTVGALVAAFDNRWSMDALNRLTATTDGTPMRRIESANDEVNHWRHFMGNLNLQNKLGAAGTLRMDLDYLRYGNNNPTVYRNTATDLGSGGVSLDRLESGKHTPLHIIVANADYTRTQEKWAFGAGLKGAFARFTNEFSFTGPVGDADWFSEFGFDSESTLREDVLAAYGSADFTPNKATTLKMGLRYELTDSNLGTEAEKDIVDRRFGTFFPSIALSHQLSDDYQLGASYARRITRPSFRDMAPFLYFVDPYTFFSGNAGLQPAIINTVKLDGTYRSMLVSLQYAWEDSTIARFQSRLLPEHNVQVMFPTNFRGTQSATALLAAPLKVRSWWSTQNNAMLMWREVDGVRNSVPVKLTNQSVRINSTQNFDLPRDFALEGSGFYQSAGLFGASDFGALWAVNLGLQKTLPNKAKLTLTVNDVFDSLDLRWTTGSPGDPLYIQQFLDFGHRSVSLTYSTRFGGDKAAKKRSTASEDERVRAQ